MSMRMKLYQRVDLNTYLCNEKNRNCPKECIHSRPHPKTDIGATFVYGVGFRNTNCSEDFFLCEWWGDTDLFVKCSIYDGGTENLFKDEI